MKKFTFLFLLYLLLSVTFVRAQQTEKFDPQKDKEELRGYTIHLMPVPGHGFGFSIVKENTVVWSQLNNPFIPGRHNGFSHKSDAFKLAEWVVGEKEKDSRTPIVFKPGLAGQLNITESLHKQ